MQIEIFESTHFTESLSITAYDLSARMLCNGLCNAIVRALKTADIPFKLTHSTHLQMLFHRKELNTTKVDWFLSNLAFMLPSSENLSKMLEEDLGSS